MSYIFNNDVALDDEFPSRQMSIFFADIVSQQMVEENGKTMMDDVRVLDHLLFGRNYVKEKVIKNKLHFRRFGERTISINQLQNTLIYSFRYKYLMLKEDDRYYYWSIRDQFKNGKIRNYQIEKASLDKSYEVDVIRRVYNIANFSKGLNPLVNLNKFNPEMRNSTDPFTKQNNHSAEMNNELLKTLLENKEISATTFHIHERNTNDAQFKESRWEYIPVKVISKTFIKSMYEIPQAFTSTLTESVTRSPLENLKSTGLEFKKGYRSIVYNLDETWDGIKRPTRGLFVEGIMGFIDTSMSVLKGSLGLVKTGVSLVGYPLFKLLSKDKATGQNRSVKMKGKRAAVVLVDTSALGKIGDTVIDFYGEEIVTSQLRGVTNHLCVASFTGRNNLDSSFKIIKDCIDRAPNDIEYIDLFSLQHSGGVDDLDKIAQYAILNRGLKPEIMMTIGCFDDPAKMTHPDETLGQAKTSWAVHYYLSNLIAKRLRGIQVSDAAKYAFAEGVPLNLVNPISIGAFFAIGSFEDSIIDGYWGSKPTVDNKRFFDIDGFVNYLNLNIDKIIEGDMHKTTSVLEQLEKFMHENSKYLNGTQQEKLDKLKIKIQSIKK